MLSFAPQNLPNEIFEKILPFLDFPDFFAFQQTSKEIHKKIRDIIHGHFYGKLFQHNKKRAFFAFKIPKNPAMDYTKKWFELAQKETSPLLPPELKKKNLTTEERFILDEKSGNLLDSLYQPLSFEELLSVKEVEQTENKEQKKIEVLFSKPYSLTFLKSYCAYYALFQEHSAFHRLKNSIDPPYKWMEFFYEHTQNKETFLNLLETTCSIVDFANEIFNFGNDVYLKNSLSNFLKGDFRFTLCPEILFSINIETKELSQYLPEDERKIFLKNLDKVVLQIFRKMESFEKINYNKMERAHVLLHGKKNFFEKIF